MTVIRDSANRPRVLIYAAATNAYNNDAEWWENKLTNDAGTMERFGFGTWVFDVRRPGDRPVRVHRWQELDPSLRAVVRSRVNRGSIAYAGMCLTQADGKALIPRVGSSDRDAILREGEAMADCGFVWAGLDWGGIQEGSLTLERIATINRGPVGGGLAVDANIGASRAIAAEWITSLWDSLGIRVLPEPIPARCPSSLKTYCISTDVWRDGEIHRLGPGDVVEVKIKQALAHEDDGGLGWTDNEVHDAMQRTWANGCRIALNANEMAIEEYGSIVYDVLSGV